jgi:hypothetical protein
MTNQSIENMNDSTLFANTPDISPEDYCVFGLATCFFREDGEVRQIEVVEPIPSAAIEAILKGIPTSYQRACAKTLREIFTEDTPQIPSELSENAQFCTNFVERTIAATRTYKSRSQAQEYIPLGTFREDLNYSVDRKRVLNAVNVVNSEDNVKQHSHTHKVL